MENEKTRGPVAAAMTDGYAKELTANDLRRVVQDIEELDGRGLLRPAWRSVATDIALRCRMLADTLERPKDGDAHHD